MKSALPDSALTTMTTASDAVREIVMATYRRDNTTSVKHDDSPVIETDRQAELAVREIISAQFPEDNIIGEEFGGVPNEIGWEWVIDPIDGTKSYIAGMPLFSTLIALAHDGVPRAGVVDFPALNERWMSDGYMTNWNDRSVSANQINNLYEAIVFGVNPDNFDGHERLAFDQLSTKCRFRRFGCDAYAFALLASGSVELVVDTGLKPYDFFSLVPVIEAAGGVITDWAGDPLNFQSDGRVLAAANRDLHE